MAGKETAASLAINAAKDVIAKAAIDPREFDLIIDFTSIPEDYVAPTWSAVLLDAVYFKARWASVFDKRLTRDEAFHLTRSQQAQVPLIQDYAQG